MENRREIMQNVSNILVGINMKEEFLVFFNMHSHTRISVISSLSSGTTLHLPECLQWNVGTTYLCCLNETFSFLWIFENSVLGPNAA